MGSRVTQPDSAAGKRKEVAEGSSGVVENLGQGRNTSPNDSDSIVTPPSNQGGADVASQVTKPMDVPFLRGRRRILIVDDETAIADTMALIFRAQHYESEVAYSAERAIEVISSWGPDLAIIDVMLPEMNGIDLAIVIKSNYPGCHVILFSGHTNTAMLLEEAGKKGHQFEVLAKPVHPDVMLDRAAELLSGPQEPLYD
jgi:CheY-like chemotaxis protein